ncbi:PREDICTED: E3 ubiquitin-protein ligase MARCH3-like [Ceratosolen solmsi marchali]|uniref:E3 ubiquitin-protein ligase MARCH3-like n=1 Tax=Ceratosolen solmsi marchali TaxID=326594 RepID=A0AAJ7DZ13_9HYME|nr:PREDICTED: E3 ubiquitin-protein ligase MARCH3-like [Ceratosolen solmsi marchali]
MSHNEECQPEIEETEIQTIELITSNYYRNSEEHHDKAKETYCSPEEKVTKEAKKNSKDIIGKINEDVPVSSSSSSNNDICRICHMGNSTSNQSCLRSDEQELENVNRIGNAVSLVNFDLGLLVSACRCRGTVGLVHTKCLERWLTESGHTRCELCGYRYATIRVPRHGILRSLLIWIRTFVATRQMLLDSLYLVVTTPLAVFSAYVCAMTLKMALENRIGDIPWTIVALLPTCSLTLVAYWGWLLTLQRLHGRRWRQYWQSNFIVQLVPDTPIAANQSNEDLNFNQDEPYEDMPDIFNII